MAADDDLTLTVKALALEAGFPRVGIATAGPVANAGRLLDWLKAGCQAGMDYMANNLLVRLSPQLLLEGARSVICLAVGYAPPGHEDPGQGAIARYARGRDYHRALKARCRKLMDRIRKVEPSFVGRAFTDSAPLMERSLAAAAGVGWIGANGCLSVPGLGSYVLLCEIVCNLPLRPDEPMPSQCDHCGACRKACPGGAWRDDGLLDAGKCVSYLTVEHRGEIGRELREAMGGRLFGCDACQEACPHNRGLPPGDGQLTGERGPPRPAPTPADVLRWRREDWDAFTRGGATRRASLPMWLRNAVIAAGNSRDAALRRPLEDLRARMPEQGEMIDWALQRLGPLAGEQ